MRTFTTTVAVMLFAATHAAAQAPRFEVASVRPNASIDPGGSMSGLTGSQFTAINVPLRLVLLSAFELRDVQVLGAPEWLATARFDIVAKFPEGTQPLAERRQMLQNLLVDRFQLLMHRESREIPVYRLVTAREDKRLGPKLVPSDVDCARWLADKKSQIIGQGPIGPGGARPACLMTGQRNYILGGTRSMAQLARSLEFVVARPVVDETGLAGNFDIDLQWAPAPGVDLQEPVVSAVADNGGSLFTALQEQLGLKLEPGRAPVDILLVESVTRPTEKN
jgi:uncharacterized protein (TIGR03435 family)